MSSEFKSFSIPLKLQRFLNIKNERSGRGEIERKNGIKMT